MWSAFKVILTVLYGTLTVLASNSDLPETCACLDNEAFGSGHPCRESCNPIDGCSDLNQRPGCWCEPGYVRINDICFPMDQCPPLVGTCPCGPNEVFGLGHSCSESCTPVDGCSEFVQRPSCWCELGYVRINDVCVPVDQCPPLVETCSCGENEVFALGHPCSESCSLGEDCSASCTTVVKCSECLGREIDCTRTCTSVQVCSDLVPRKSCWCAPGYARINDVCVPMDQCPPLVETCGPNEEFVFGHYCNESCAPVDGCSDLTQRRSCWCKPGFVRINGICAPMYECPPPLETCAENEDFGLGHPCREPCDPDEGCIDVEVYEYNGCFCRDGYKRINGICLPANECPPITPTCMAPEVYKLSHACRESCIPVDGCADLIATSGEYRCWCDDGYARVNDVCVPMVQCPVVYCGPNEEFGLGNSCNESCTPDEGCSDLAQQIQCWCKPGFVRINGTCGRRIECPPPVETCAENEVYGLGHQCREECAAIEWCVDGEIEKYDGCFCLDGLKRINDVCRPEAECPFRPTCAMNEEWRLSNECKESCTPDEQCDTLEYYICSCKPGYARINNICVIDIYCP